MTSSPSPFCEIRGSWVLGPTLCLQEDANEPPPLPLSLGSCHCCCVRSEDACVFTVDRCVLSGVGGAGRSEGAHSFQAGALLIPTSLILSTVHKIPLVLIRCPRINSILILNLIKNRFPLIHLPSGSEIGIRTVECCL